MSLQPSLGLAVKLFREAQGLSQQELGDRLGFSRKTAHVYVYKVEKALILPTPGLTMRLATALGVTAAGLVMTAEVIEKGKIWSPSN